jgi:predicted amidohydrolase
MLINDLPLMNRSLLSTSLVATVMLWLLAASASAELFSNFTDRAGWSSWAPRDDIAPAFEVSSNAGRMGDTALKISTDAESDFGAWKKRFSGISGGKNYRFDAWYRVAGVKHDARSVAPRLEWLDASAKQLRPPEYAIAVEEKDGWQRVRIVSPAPEKAFAVEIQLGFGFVKNASVLWDDISFGEEESARDRVVKVATIFHRPRGTKSAAESVESFCELTKKSLSGSVSTDIICLPEGITVVGNGKSYYEVGEAIPGPTTKRLSELAKELKSYIVAGIYEKEGSVLYNTAILLGRDGNLVGKYRKTHLPREEWEAGITPGDEYPVFETDFGKVGLIICWDVQFPEPSRAMARKGAEVLLLPIWGGNETLAKARAIENHVFLVSSSYDMKTFVVDPEGKVLAEATKEQPVAIADLHLDRKIFQYWLGDMKARTWRERRPDLAID